MYPSRVWYLIFKALAAWFLVYDPHVFSMSGTNHPKGQQRNAVPSLHYFHLAHSTPVPRVATAWVQHNEVICITDFKLSLSLHINVCPK